MPKRSKRLEDIFPDRAADVGYNSEFLWSHIDDSAGADYCWEWTGARHKQGYGMLGGYRIATQKKLMMTVHRLLMKIKTNQDPGLQDVIHTCGNMRCCNPNHLVLGDAKLISDMRMERGYVNGGALKGVQRTGPRNQKYRWGLENIIAVYRNEITDIEFARRNQIKLKQARKIIGEMRSGAIYPWLKRGYLDE